MDVNAIQEWATCEEEFKALLFKITNENPSDKTEVLAMRFPAKTATTE
jgi:hypothetical protein